MAVSTHLKIALGEYDRRIRTFVPHYEEMLDVAAQVLAASVRHLRVAVDLGIGTGALAARVAAAAPGVALVGIDEDPGMQAMAKRRLRAHEVDLLCADFVRATLPRCDAVTASLALHHIERRRTRLALFARARRAIRAGGMLVTADYHPPSHPALAAAGHEAWLAHVARTYGPRKARAFLRAWEAEDFYVPLDAEIALLQSAGFRTDVVWRRDGFAVIAGR